ncbi:flagellar basal body-associated protein FliL [Glaciecola petra]|uniref:Flagellar protein FliL n=1 Tax=Glaciecola petra TaxID=3075602 RepID=A0ABU2ZMH3_9ALTE|nr:flagellar basal body-associated protein FliL [Aestuariibacter sp. P117]MDT0593815.1 flagellar basal body-associated protein FliL [Aestuariibacter sp. P117]
MAEELTTEDGGKKKSKLMLIIIVAVVLLLGGGGGAYYFLFMGDEQSAETDDTEASAEMSESTENEGRAIYVAMPRPFQFNAPGAARERLVQIEVQLMVRGAENEERAQRHIPMIEGNLLQVFSAANADDLVTELGKKELRTKSTSQVRQILNELENNPVVEQVLFTGFVIQ